MTLVERAEGPRAPLESYVRDAALEGASDGSGQQASPPHRRDSR